MVDFRCIDIIYLDKYFWDGLISFSAVLSDPCKNNIKDLNIYDFGKRITFQLNLNIPPNNGKVQMETSIKIKTTRLWKLEVTEKLPFKVSFPYNQTYQYVEMTFFDSVQENDGDTQQIFESIKLNGVENCDILTATTSKSTLSTGITTTSITITTTITTTANTTSMTTTTMTEEGIVGLPDQNEEKTYLRQAILLPVIIASCSCLAVMLCIVILCILCMRKGTEKSKRRVERIALRPDAEIKHTNFRDDSFNYEDYGDYSKKMPLETIPEVSSSKEISRDPTFEYADYDD